MTLLAGLRERARFLKQETLALYLAVRDPRTPWYAKLLGVVIVAYALSPVDLIPDFIPVIGYLDDLVLVPLGIALLLRLVDPEVMAEARLAAAEAVGKAKRTALWAAAVVVAIWLLVAWAAVRWAMQAFAAG
ncbi:MAG: YkvA family protein [Burkholderiales bacterium]|nr:YkvA family protein [Burkholderiales bacterium]